MVAEIGELLGWMRVHVRMPLMAYERATYALTPSGISANNSLLPIPPHVGAAKVRQSSNQRLDRSFTTKSSRKKNADRGRSLMDLELGSGVQQHGQCALVFFHVEGPPPAGSVELPRHGYILQYRS
jgi:hypothetical protein